MSNATISSPKKSRSRSTIAAKWDDEKSGILLEDMDIEINNGKRPSGVYSRTGWFNIVKNFNERTSRDFNKDQIKNRMDNLRRDYICWEKLIGKETGLGWDHQKRTLAAPDHWWYEKAKYDPTILKYKDIGPIHLELMQRVFGGVTATGAYRYNPGYTIPDPLLDSRSHIEVVDDIIDFTVDVEPTMHADVVGSEGNPMSTPNNTPSTIKLNPHKRPRSSTSGRMSEVDKFGNKVDSLTDTIRESMTTYIKARTGEDDSNAYADALALLRAMPGMGPDHPVFVKAIRVLENKLRCVAFINLLDFGENAVLAWLRTFPDSEY